MSSTNEQKTQDNIEEEEELGLDTDMGEGSIKLVSKDNQAFEVDRAYTAISNLVKTSIESDDAADEVPIPGVDGDTLEKVVEYMNHHKGTEPELVAKPLRSKIMKEVCKDEWDATYIDGVGTDVANLYRLILAANYMDITGLLHLGAAKVASLAKGETPERIAEILNPDGVVAPAEDKAE